MGFSDRSFVFVGSRRLGVAIDDVEVLLGIIGFVVEVGVTINIVGVDVSFNVELAAGDISGVGVG